MATFAATFKDFPEANAPLGAGNNENTYGIVIHRASQGVYSKIIFSDEEVQKMIETKCAYLFVKGPYYPMSVLVDSPFISGEQLEDLLNAEVESINKKLSLFDSTDVSKPAHRIDKNITYQQALALNMNFGRNFFEGCPYLVEQISKTAPPPNSN